MKYRCYASCAFGIEGILAEEIRRLGIENVAAQDARVYFDACEAEIAKANIFLRTADRVYIVLDEFDAITFDELFEGIRKFDFASVAPSDARIPVDANAVRSELMSVSDIQSISKKAIVDAMRRVYKEDRLPENGNVFNVFVNIYKNRVTLALNSSGAGLNRRGYRLKNVQAPLKETLAAAMILISKWRTRDFFDPMCGSGTIPIEAAMIAADMAPGIKRRFDAQSYSNIFRNAFADAREEAKAKIVMPKMKIMAGDIDRKNVNIAREHARNMDVSEYMDFYTGNVSEIRTFGNPSSIITNPPYAVRLGEKEDTERLYRNMGRAFDRLEDTLVFVICANDKFEKLYGKKADKKRKLYNGNLKCTYYQYFRKRID